ncbi:hypothetical protein J437_LFUL004233 [Ladona fulva]|uniref:Nuclear receptor domain-containing protein n=1 Tax=Ladona fulva TaxID=123851 RepID=A0A8K0K4I3_LADFU|nr:hypothetical protein J437_LFUL004233 [Ladona fulva]
MNQLCRVCGEPAAGFHFGAFTCEGCKSFFGRTYNNLGSISECKNGGVCVINKKNRTSCKACRLRKCLMVGMSKSGSRYGRRSNWFKIHCLLQEQQQHHLHHHHQRPLPFSSTASEHGESTPEGPEKRAGSAPVAWPSEAARGSEEPPRNTSHPPLPPPLYHSPAHHFPRSRPPIEHTPEKSHPEEAPLQAHLRKRAHTHPFLDRIPGFEPSAHWPFAKDHLPPSSSQMFHMPFGVGGAFPHLPPPSLPPPAPPPPVPLPPFPPGSKDFLPSYLPYMAVAAAAVVAAAAADAAAGGRQSERVREDGNPPSSSSDDSSKSPPASGAEDSFGPAQDSPMDLSVKGRTAQAAGNGEGVEDTGEDGATEETDGRTSEECGADEKEGKPTTPLDLTTKT